MSAAGLPTAFPAEKFWALVDKSGDCWLYTGFLNQGYGVFTHRRKNYRAHRVVWMMAGRTIPDGLVMDHLCRVRNCVKPDHLEPVTPRENVLRGIGPTAMNAQKIECDQGHHLAGENVMVSTVGAGRKERRCRQCSNAKARRSNGRRLVCTCGRTIVAASLHRHQRRAGCAPGHSTVTAALATGGAE